GLGLQLVAQVAHVPEVELKRQLRRQRDPPPPQLVVQVVEDALATTLRGLARSVDGQDTIRNSILDKLRVRATAVAQEGEPRPALHHQAAVQPERVAPRVEQAVCGLGVRSEEHTSELQSRENLVCRLL